MNRSTRLACLVLALTACSNSSFAPLEHDVDVDQALGQSIHRDLEAPVQTDSLVYHLTWNHPWYSVSIPFRYRNETGSTISIVNCHGGLNVGLEKRVGDDWVPFYFPALLRCLSAPIQIAAGTVYEARAGIHGSMPGYAAAPTFASDELDGEYRLIWGSLVIGYDTTKQGFGKPVGPLRSNSFLLVTPD